MFGAGTLLPMCLSNSRANLAASRLHEILRSVRLVNRDPGSCAADMSWKLMTLDQCYIYHKTSNIRRTLVGNKIVDHSDVVGKSPVGAAPTTSSFSTSHTFGFSGLGNNDCKTRRETSKLWYLVRLILEV